MISYQFLSKESLSSDDLMALSRLLEQLLRRPLPLDRETAEQALSQARILVARDEMGKIVGTASLYLLDLFHHVEGRVEEVIVDEAARGQGIGKELMRRLVDEGRARGVKTIFLTSNPSRVEANHLYQALGFERYETNVYRLKL